MGEDYLSGDFCSTLANFLRYTTCSVIIMEKAMAPQFSTLAWKIPWTGEPGRLQSTGLLRVGHDWVTSLSLFTFMHWRRKWQPTSVFLPGESQGRGSLVGCRLWGRTESDTTDTTKQQQQWLSFRKNWQNQLSGQNQTQDHVNSESLEMTLSQLIVWWTKVSWYLVLWTEEFIRVHKSWQGQFGLLHLFCSKWYCNWVPGWWPTNLHKM